MPCFYCIEWSKRKMHELKGKVKGQDETTRKIPLNAHTEFRKESETDKRKVGGSSFGFGFRMEKSLRNLF